MATKPTRGDLKAEFRATGVDLVDAGDLDLAYAMDRDEKRQDQARTEQVLIGMDDAEVLLAGRRGLYGITAARDIQVAHEAREKAASDDALFLLILNGGDLAGFIADKVFDDMSDTEIADLVAQIESKTGMGFEDYARGILGDEAVARKPGESDANYQRRMLKAVAAEVIDPETGEIKPEYRDDPVAQIVMGDGRYKDIVAKVRTWKSQLASGVSPDKIRPSLKVETDKAYDAAATTGDQIGESSLTATARGSQDVHRDSKLSSNTSDQNNEAVIAGILPPVPKAEGALASAQADLEANFEKASKPESKTVADNSPELNANPAPRSIV
ncbi:MAG: hypothetical protein KDC18_12650 [Alphaproteobacteria bacterium]|nr:hypothetical protein [Alphaproteobacteria bacterium]